MKRILLSGAILIAVGAFLVLSTAASNRGNANGTYKIELDNAFGLTSGADFNSSTSDICLRCRSGES